jgi:signal transduction histidine kinase/ligand-binding sensor domain-containing protein
VGARLAGWVVVGVIGGLLLTPPVCAQYRIDSWTNETGLPGNAVTSIVQTPDGYLWFGTFAGLVRFDGVRFAVIEGGPTGPRSHRILAMHVDHTGAIWMGTERGGLTRYANGTFTTYTTKDGLPNDNVLSVNEDRRGRLWLASSGALIKFEGGRFTTYTTRDGLPATPSSRVIEDQQGKLWFGTGLGLVRFDVDGDPRTNRVTTITTRDGLPGNYVRSVIEMPDGSLWVGTDRNGIAHVLPERFTSGAARVAATYTTAQGLPSDRVRSLFRDRAGQLWISTEAGIGLLRDDTIVRYLEPNGRPDNYINVVFEDRESNIWIGTRTDGLKRFKRQPLMSYMGEHGLPASSVVPIVEDTAGTLWIGRTCGGLVRYRDGAVTTFAEKADVPNDCVWSLLPARDGSLWIGTWGGGLTHLQDKRFTTVTHTQAGIPLGAVLALYQDRAGAIWIGTAGGLHRFNADGTFNTWWPRDGLVYEDVRFITEDHQGAMWIGTFGGVSRLDPARGTFTNYTVENGLSNNFVLAIHETRDGTIWLGTHGGGLNRFKDGKFVHITAKHGLFENIVSSILEDDRGNFWMSGYKSIFRVARQDLDGFADGRLDSIMSASYLVTNGGASNECTGGGQPAGWKARDGRLWFPTSHGVIAIDPTKIAHDTLAPPVVVDQVLVDRREQDPRQAIQVPPAGDLEIHYTGLSFSQPESVRFKYKLSGLDANWTDAGARRTAYYSHLPAGRYTFTVIAANPEGVWNQTGASVGLEVVPPFYRTWQFMTVATLALVVLVLSIYEGRIRRLRQAHAARVAFSAQLIDSQERERARIAAELHDSLGQQLVIIKNRALLGTQHTPEPTLDDLDPAREQFDEIAATAAAAIDEVREIAYHLRPIHLDRLGLRSTIEAMVERVSTATGMTFDVDLQQLDGLLSKDAEINLYRVLQESVTNISKHAQATQASIAITREDGALHITVRDNGRGFQPETRKAAEADRPQRRASGLGLAGIEERMRILGGTHVVRSSPGRGTTIEFRIPLRPSSDAPAPA